MNVLSVESRRHPVAGALAWLLLTFLVLFPKGGVKLGDLPLTWGYLLLGLTLAPLAVVRLVAMPLVWKPRTLAVFASLIPFQVLYLYSFLVNGVESASFAASLFVSFFILPVAFLLIYPAFLPFLRGESFAKYLRFCIFVAAVYGIFLFAWRPITGHMIEIPYLTVNADDAGQLETTKHISRGFFLKLISTYNNGNLYGIATLILMPFYDVLEKKAWRRATLKLALALTLSRTVWAGLIADQMLSMLRLVIQAGFSFPRVVFGPALKRGLLLVVMGGLIFAALTLSSQDLSYLFDSQLGGRATSLVVFTAPTLLPAMPVGGFVEILYVSALGLFGVSGMLAIILIFVFPIPVLLTDRSVLRSPLRTAGLKGIILYMLVACSDGATNLIPVMAFYWFAYMVFLESWPGGIDLLPANRLEHRPAAQSSMSGLAATASTAAAGIR